MGNFGLAGHDMHHVSIGDNPRAAEIIAAIRTLLADLRYDADLEEDSAEKNRACKELDNATQALETLNQDKTGTGLQTLNTFAKRLQEGTTAAHKLFDALPEAGAKLGELAAKVALLLGL